MSKFNLTNKIKGVLRSKKSEQFKVNSEFDNRLLSSIQKKESGHSAKEGSSYFDGLAQFISGIFNRYALAMVAIVLVIGGFWFNGQNSYASHLHKAKLALAELESVISGNPQIGFIPAAFAEADGDVDEEAVADLTEEVVEETEAAIEAAEDISDPQEVEIALEEIAELQEDEIEVLAEAAEVVESEVATEVVAEALEITAEEQALVEEARSFVEDALETGEESVNIDIETSADQQENERLEKAEARFEEAQEAFAQLVEAGASEEEIGELEEMLEKVEAALEDGKAGRAYGLSTAMRSRIKHTLRKVEKDEDREIIKRAEEQLEEARVAFEALGESGVDEEEIAHLEGKFELIEVALEDDKHGRVYGLSTAVEAKGKSMAVQAKREAEREAKQAEREAEREARQVGRGG